MDKGKEEIFEPSMSFILDSFVKSIKILVITFFVLYAIIGMIGVHNPEFMCPCMYEYPGL